MEYKITIYELLYSTYSNIKLFFKWNNFPK